MASKAKKSAKAEAECAFCDFMHKSPCAAPFIEWEKCFDRCTNETADADAASEAETKPAPTEPLASPKTSTPVSPSMTPEPYRITIRLTGADPAAPAEVVTRALREADVRFAVERIERVQP